MKMNELQDKTEVELQARGRELRQEKFNLMIQKATSQLENPARIKRLRRDIARVETQLSALRRKASKS